MPALAHTPYDGSRTPFSIGLQPLDPAGWIEPDEHLADHLAQKERLLASGRDVVFREEAGTREAQAELRDLLAAHLVARHPDIYVRDGRGLHIAPAGRTVDLGADAPLAAAARLVQEDLCLMRAGEGGYRLAAAALCFPSSWSLAETFGRTLDGLHARVPGYPDRMAARMNRIFASLHADRPVWRLNWSLYADGELHHPESKARPRDWFSGEGAGRAFVRVERQTLRRLPQSGDIVFTIKVCVDPLAAFRGHPEGGRLAAGLRDQILSLDDDQLAYKALLADRDRVVAALDRIVAWAGR